MKRGTIALLIACGATILGIVAVSMNWDAIAYEDEFTFSSEEEARDCFAALSREKRWSWLPGPSGIDGAFADWVTWEGSADEYYDGEMGLPNATRNPAVLEVRLHEYADDFEWNFMLVQTKPLPLHTQEEVLQAVRAVVPRLKSIEEPGTCEPCKRNEHQECGDIWYRVENSADWGFSSNRDAYLQCYCNSPECHPKRN